MIYSIYEKSPIFVQNIVCSLYGFFEKRKRFNTQFAMELDALIKSDFYGPEEIRKLKEKRLALSLLNAKRSGFYKILESVSDKDIVDSPFAILKILPVLTKDELRKFDESTLKTSSKTQTAVTSGTTGKALKLVREVKCFAIQWAVWFRHRYRFGITFGDESVNFSGKPIVPLRQVGAPYWRYNAPMKQHLLSMQHINEETIEDIVKFLNTLKPKYYSGYPSIVSEVARLALNKGLKLNKTATPRVVFTGAEKLLKHQVAAIEKWLGRETVITDQYGLTEGNCNFSQCERGNYHEDFEFCHIEVIDGVQEKDGSTTGKLVGTTFHNEALPLIRYETGDLATVANENFKCECGRSSRVILNVDGRVDDYVLLPNGQRVMRFDYLFKDTFEVIEAQVVQKEKRVLDIIAVLSNDGDQYAFENKVSSHFKEYITTSMTLRFSYVERIARTSTGKFKAVVNELNII